VKELIGKAEEEAKADSKKGIQKLQKDFEKKSDNINEEYLLKEKEAIDNIVKKVLN
jgi:hypothetical protein